VAESLAQRHPQLKSLVAAAHSHFCSRIHIRNADGRPPPGGRVVCPSCCQTEPRITL
jgi:hypothetical protein